MDTNTHPDKPEHPPAPPPITYELEDEPYTTTETTLTPRAILGKGGFDVETHYLALLHGESGERTSYQGKPDEPIHMHPNMKFLAISTGPTPVS
jgi:hypothetical protein